MIGIARRGTPDWMVEFRHRVERDDLAFGVVRAEGVEVGPAPTELASALDAVLGERASGELDEETDARRRAARDVLRNGSYKPTGRGKPASEYLLRAAQGEFPRINGPVDANNLVSLRYMLPISVLDLDRAISASFELRLGGDERYVFNSAGQSLELRDLVCGCVVDEGASRPLITPIKDGMASKIEAGTRRVAGVVYAPLISGEALIREITEEFARWLACCGDEVKVSADVLMPEQVVSL
jgi:DNA/RNA-binding domain of Phe-tRNA-synthetase-like protein